MRRTGCSSVTSLVTRMVLGGVGSPTLVQMLSCTTQPYLKTYTKRLFSGIPHIHIKSVGGRMGNTLQSHSKRGLTTSAEAVTEKELVIIGGGNAAGYAADAFIAGGAPGSSLCIIGAESVPPYERPALTKGFLFPPDAKPARLPGFHTCVGGGGERHTKEWYDQQGIQLHLGTEVTGVDFGTRLLTLSQGPPVKFSKLLIATGSVASRFPAEFGGSLPGVHYVRNVADAEALVEAMSSEGTKRAVVVGGGYIGMETAAALSAWSIPTTVAFPEGHLMPRLFTPAIAAHYERLYESRGVRLRKGVSVETLTAGPGGRVSGVSLGDGSAERVDLVVVGVGAKPVVKPFVDAGLEGETGGIKVDGHFQTSVPGVYAIGDVAAFPLKMYGRTTRVEHVDHARKSAKHAVASILGTAAGEYDYLPYFYSRVFEHPGSERKVFWQFYGDNVGECVVVGDFAPKLAAFWLDQGKVVGVFLESGSAEEVAMLPQIARSQPRVSVAELSATKTVEQAFALVGGPHL